MPALSLDFDTFAQTGTLDSQIDSASFRRCSIADFSRDIRASNCVLALAGHL